MVNGLNSNVFLYSIFAGIIFLFLYFELGLFQKRKEEKKIPLNKAIKHTIAWICVSLLFSFLVFFIRGSEQGLQFLSAYITEYTLSIDNLFVILLILEYFKIKDAYYHKVLSWGIFGAIIMRAIFIIIGAFIVEKFHPILYVFGAILLYSGIKMFLNKGKEEQIDFRSNRVMRLARKYLPFTTQQTEGEFVVKENGKRYFTLLSLVVLLIESTDLIFALDSIPAAFSISQEHFILYSSNILAVMGLRSLFFLLKNIVHKFHYLQLGLSIVLIFIGAKMLLGIFDVQINATPSFVVIMSAILGSVVLSLMFPQKLSQK